MLRFKQLNSQSITLTRYIYLFTRPLPALPFYPYKVISTSNLKRHSDGQFPNLRLKNSSSNKSAMSQTYQASTSKMTQEFSLHTLTANLKSHLLLQQQETSRPPPMLPHLHLVTFSSTTQSSSLSKPTANRYFSLSVSHSRSEDNSVSVMVSGARQWEICQISACSLLGFSSGSWGLTMPASSCQSNLSLYMSLRDFFNSSGNS